jgi:hypothetical protein
MTESNLNYENISIDYNANQEDTAGENTLGGGDIILTDLVGAAATAEDAASSGGSKTIAGWGVGGIEADDDDHDIIFDPDGDLLPPIKPAGGGGDIDVPDTIIWDLDGGNVAGGGDFILVDLVGAPATIDDAADQEIGGDFILVDIVGTSDGGAGRSSTDSGGHDPIADMLSRQENVSMEGRESLDAAGLDVVIGSATTETSAEGGTLILVDSFDSEQDYQTNADPYRQFNFTVELGDDASAGPADAYFVSTDASTVTESAPAIGGGEIILVNIVGSSAGAEFDGGGHDLRIFDTNIPMNTVLEGGETSNEGVTTHEYGHGISIRQVGSTEADDSFDYTPQPGNQEVPVPPDEIIIMPDPTCPPEQILDDRGYTDFLGHEGDSAASGGGGDFILVDIVGSSANDTDLMLA